MASFNCPTCQSKVHVKGERPGMEFKRKCRKCRREWLIRLVCAECGTGDDADHSQGCMAPVPTPISANFHARRQRQVPTGPGHYRERRFA